MIDLKRLKEYVDIGFSKEEALELVQKEESEEGDKEKQDADSLKQEVESLKEQLSKKNEEDKEAEKKDVEVKKETEKSMSLEEAFKNIFK